jgi:hypothetical protein
MLAGSHQPSARVREANSDVGDLAVSRHRTRDVVDPHSAISCPSRRARKPGLGMPAKVSFPSTNLRVASARLGQFPSLSSGRLLASQLTALAPNFGRRSPGESAHTKASGNMQAVAMLHAGAWPPYRLPPSNGGVLVRKVQNRNVFEASAGVQPHDPIRA